MVAPSKIKVKRQEASVMKNLVGKRITRSVNFMGEKLEISKLSVQQGLDIQELAKKMADAPEDEGTGMEILMAVIKASVPGAAELSEEDFTQFPMDELSKLSKEIMQFSGMAGEEPKGN